MAIREGKPAPPFITSQMQQAAARRHGFGVKKTMTLAQHLYEGKDIGERGSWFWVAVSSSRSPFAL